MSGEQRDAFDLKMDVFERRVKRLFAFVVATATALAATVVLLLAAWDQVRDAQRSMRADVAAVDANVERVEDNTIANNSRLDAIGAPPPEED